MMKLISAEGTVYDEKYYTVQVYNENSRWLWKHVEDWCKVTFGDTPKDGVWTPNARWYMNNRTFWFREKKDLEWFIIRWT
jgi:hypothetical protein